MISVYIIICYNFLFTMAGGNNAQGGSGGCSGGRGGCVRGCSYNTLNNRSTKMGLCKDLEFNIFDFGAMTCADLMQTTQEKIVQYVTMVYGGDIANKL